MTIKRNITVGLFASALSIGALSLSATGCGGTKAKDAGDTTPAAHEKGADASCGAGSCGADKAPAPAEKGADASCGAEGCGTDGCGASK